MHDSLLAGYRWFGKVFGGEFLISTMGVYKPLGYALFGVLRSFVGPEQYLLWHLLFSLLLFGAVLFVYAVFRDLWGETWWAAIVAAGLFLHPAAVPLLGDVNRVDALFGVFFLAVALWGTCQLIEKKKLIWLVVAGLAYCCAVFSWPFALAGAGGLFFLAFLQNRQPKLAGAGLVCLGTVGLTLIALGLSPAIVAAVLVGIALAVGSATSPGKEEIKYAMGLAGALIPAACFYWAVANCVEPRPVFNYAILNIRAAKLWEPHTLPFVYRSQWKQNWLAIAGICGLPLLAFALSTSWKKWLKVSITVVVLAILLLSNVGLSKWYRDDATYWEHMERCHMHSIPVALNLAQAYVNAARWEKAKDLLLRLAFVGKVQRLYADIVNMRLGQVFSGLGNDKVAGFFFFIPPESCIDGSGKFSKNRLIIMGDFYFRLGYMSYAENCYACSLVLDPYDLSVYNRLGKVLVYKDFFRAAQKYFRYVLSIDPDNVTALYYSAFLAKKRDDQPTFKTYARRWAKATGRKMSDIDFSAILDGYRFNKEQTIEWFSDQPYKLFRDAKIPRTYVLVYQGKTYLFWEVPFEVGKHFFSKQEYKLALGPLEQAHALNPDSLDVSEYLIKNYEALGMREKAQVLKRSVSTKKQ